MMNRMLSAVAVLALLMTASCSPPSNSTGGQTVVEAPAQIVPDWAVPYMGQNIADVFITSMSRDGCIGFVDGATAQPNGSQIVLGWAFSTMHNKAYDRLLATDANGVIIGGGTTDSDRADVTSGNPNITTPRVGFTVAAQGTGPVLVFGIDETASTRCPIGQ